MKQKSNTPETPSERLVRDIRRDTRNRIGHVERAATLTDLSLAASVVISTLPDLASLKDATIAPGLATTPSFWPTSFPVAMRPARPTRASPLPWPSPARTGSEPRC